MRDDYRNNHNRSVGIEKKKNRIKNHNIEDDECKCFVPAAKFHHFDCPLIRKPCPIHGGRFYFNVKEEKVEDEMEDCVVISFRPSLKTDKLFRPVKSLLSRHCSPETKINFQYISPRDYNREPLKSRFIQTEPETLLNYIGNGYFVEKTKNHITDRNYRIKKLKQCFHSPCDSIAQKSRSQTNLKDKLAEVFKEDSKKTQDVSVSAGRSYQENFDRERKSDFLNTDLGWFCCRKTASSDGERSSAKELSDSGFLTLTQPVRSNFLNPKIFQLKQKKGVSDILKSKKKPVDYATQYFFSSVSSDIPNENLPSKTKKKEPPLPEEAIKKGNSDPDDSSDDEQKEKPHKTSSGSEDSQTESSTSVYFTPFILIPADIQESEKTAESAEEPEIRSRLHAISDPRINDKAVQHNGVESEISLQLSNFYGQIQRERKISEKTITYSSEGHRNSVDVTKRASMIFREFEKEKKNYSDHQLTPSKSFQSIQINDKITQTEEENLIFSKQTLTEEPEIARKEDKSSLRLTKSKGSSIASTAEFMSEPEFLKAQSPVVVNSEERQNKEFLKYKHKFFKDVKIQTSQTLLNFLKKEIENNLPKKMMRNRSSQTVKKTFEDAEVDATAIGISKSQTSLYSPSIKTIHTSEMDLGNWDPAWWRKSRSDGELYEKKYCDCIYYDGAIPLHHCCCRQPDSSSVVEIDDGYKNSKTTCNIIYSHKSTSVKLIDETTNTVQISTKDECVNSSLSDLGELIKIINQNFGETAKFFREKHISKENIIDSEIINDSVDLEVITMNKKTEEPIKELVDAKTQTIPIKPEQIMPQKLEHPPNQSNQTTVCEMCLRKINTTLVDPSTSPEPLKAKPKSNESERRVEPILASAMTKKKSPVKMSFTVPKKLNHFDKNKEILKKPTGSASRPSGASTLKKPIQNEMTSAKSGRPSPSHKKCFESFETFTARSTTRRVNTIKSPSKKPPVTRTKPEPEDRQKTSRYIPEPGTSTLPSRALCECPSQTDIYASLPVKPWPGEKTKTKPKQNIDRFTYHMSESPFWPRDLVGNLQKAQPKTEQPSSSSTNPGPARTNNKRNLERENDIDVIPIGKKIKCEILEKGNFFDICSEKNPFLENPKPEVVSCSIDSKLVVKKINRNTLEEKKVNEADTGPSSCFFTYKILEEKLKEEKTFRLYKCDHCKSLTYVGPRENNYLSKLIYTQQQQQPLRDENNLLSAQEGYLDYVPSLLEDNRSNVFSYNKEFLGEWSFIFKKNDLSRRNSPKTSEENDKTFESRQDLNCLPNTVEDAQSSENLLSFTLPHQSELPSTSKPLSPYWFKAEKQARGKRFKERNEIKKTIRTKHKKEKKNKADD